ncbi:MAG: hypothetical protein PHG97_06030 [Candidatus Margulisbacteria bacterium]|nr:hypothetical protein [Candidatus Margulisiibacteriota bacterium]
MIGKASAKKYTVADLYTEAAKMVKGEMSALKNKPLDPEETEKAEALARFISKTVLKEMKVV